MLVLTRKQGERILIADPIGRWIEIQVTRLGGETVRLGITAPPAFCILRAELIEQREARTGTVTDSLDGWCNECWADVIYMNHNQGGCDERDGHQ